MKWSKAARRFSEQIAVLRRRYAYRIPTLKVADQALGMPPTAWFICPDFNEPSGGIRKLYRSVDILNGAGLQAAIVHRKPSFRCTWFDNSTRVVDSAQVVVGQRDLIVVPEVYGRSIADLPKGIRRIIFNQGAYLMLDLLISEPSSDEVYLSDPDLAAVVVVSEDSAAVVSYAFPGLHVQCIRNSIDPAIFYPSSVSKSRRIAYMPRRRSEEADQVLRLLTLRGALKGWEVIAIENRTESEVADLLRTVQIFLSFSKREGFGLPPLEALACGCLVVGYTGFGGREFFRPPFATAIEDGDVVAFARTVENTIHLIDNNSEEMVAAGTAGARFALGRYSRDAERVDLLGVFNPLLS
jgi:hypothetical protein